MPARGFHYVGRAHDLGPILAVGCVIKTGVSVLKECSSTGLAEFCIGEMLAEQLGVTSDFLLDGHRSPLVAPW